MFLIFSHLTLLFVSVINFVIFNEKKVIKIRISLIKRKISKDYLKARYNQSKE